MHLFIATIISTVASINAFNYDLNMNVNPCHDFYEHVCGNWIRKQTIEPTKVERSGISEMKEHTYQVVQEIAEEGSHPLIKDFWDSCVGMEKIKELGIEPLKHDLNSISNPDIDSKVKLFELVGQFARIGTTVFVRGTVEPDFENPKIYTLSFSPADFVLPSRKYYTPEKFQTIERDYRIYINSMMKLSRFTTDGEAADIVMKMEFDLLKIQYGLGHLPTKHVTMQYAKFWWTSLFGSYIKGLDGHKIKKQSKGFWSMKYWYKKTDLLIQISSPEYFSEVQELIDNTSLEDLKVFVAFKLLHSRAYWLSPRFYTTQLQFFRRTLMGQKKIAPRTTECVQRLIDFFPQLIGKYFDSTEITPVHRSIATDIVQGIKHVMKQRIQNSDWLDKDTRHEALHKLMEMTELIGQTYEPPHYTFTLSGDTYAANIRKILLYRFEYMLKLVNHRVNRFDFGIFSSAATVNAFYLPTANQIVVHPAMLQPPMLYIKDYGHPAINFGGIGSTIGHEITHGFDSMGFQFDGNGKRRAWWSEGTKKGFISRAQCLIDQYNEFQAFGEGGRLIGTVNGEMTLNENIADNAGVSLAWDAYKQHMKKYEDMSGSTLTQTDQLFFIAFGESHCRKATDKYLNHLLIADIHSPAEWRVNGVVQNNRDFAEAFGCPPWSEMYRTDQCKIW